MCVTVMCSTCIDYMYIRTCDLYVLYIDYSVLFLCDLYVLHLGCL